MHTFARIGFLGIVAAGAAAADWPDFRGPAGDGHAPRGNPPLTWAEDRSVRTSRNVRWKTRLPGRAWSSPVVLGRQVWLTTATEDGRSMSALCVDRESGRVLLNRELFANAAPEPLGLGKEGNTYASPSPVAMPGRVFLHFGTYGTACLDTGSFRLLWQRRDLNCVHSVGPGSSPVLFRDRLILTLDGTDQQYLVALDAKTGRTVWRTPRSADWSFGDPADRTPQHEQRKAFSTPLLTQHDGRSLLVSSGAKATYGYDPATGRELWRVAYRGFSNGSRPVAGLGFAFVNTGYHRAELWAVRLGGSGDVTGSHVAWKYTRNVPLNPSPILVGELLYLVNAGGIVTCLDARTGEEVWKERLAGPFTASPVHAAGRLFLFAESGAAYVLAPGRVFERVAENRLDDGPMASPAVAGDAWIVRTKTHLYCLEERAAPQ